MNLATTISDGALALTSFAMHSFGPFDDCEARIDVARALGSANQFEDCYARLSEAFELADDLAE